jgi:hypothetical protein
MQKNLSGCNAKKFKRSSGKKNLNGHNAKILNGQN